MGLPGQIRLKSLYKLIGEVPIHTVLPFGPQSRTAREEFSGSSSFQVQQLLDEYVIHGTGESFRVTNQSMGTA